MILSLFIPAACIETIIGVVAQSNTAYFGLEGPV
jgi:hypothetical protein